MVITTEVLVRAAREIFSLWRAQRFAFKAAACGSQRLERIER